MSEKLFRTEALTTGYGDIQVLWGVDLDVEEGEIVCLVGSNGAGKSTLLKCVSGLLPQTGGRILMKGTDVSQATPDQILEAGIAQVPEGRRLFSAMSVRNNLLMGAYMRCDGQEAIQKDLRFVFELFPILAERMGQNAGTLSGGEQQMCAIARGIMSKPALLMIDELSLGLAPLMIERLGKALLDINRSGISILLVEQDVTAAFELSRRGFVLESGRVVLSGATAELAKNSMVQEAYMGI
ncbi:MAG: ABC transporter ATP-binding protein [Deltaproteobacteria bacterium]|nr:ABC transporter ATP-binding protein [Deltaproteobacteria bacterium]